MVFNPGCFSLPPTIHTQKIFFKKRLVFILALCFRIETRVQIWTPENILKQMKENTTNNAPRIPFHRRRHQSLQPRVRICSVWHGTKYSKRGSSIETIIYIVTSWNQTPTTIEYRNHHLKPKHYLSIDTSHTSRLFQLSGFPVSSGIFQKSESKTIGCNFKKCGGCISHSKQIKFLKTTRLKTPVLFHSASDRCFFFPLGDVSSQLGVWFFFHPEAFGALPNNSWLGYAVYIIHYTDLEILQICYKKSFFCAFLVERN